MGVRIVADHDRAVFYCSTSCWAFGPVMSSAEEAQAFADWLAPTDPRSLSDGALAAAYNNFCHAWHNARGEFQWQRWFDAQALLAEAEHG